MPAATHKSDLLTVLDKEFQKLSRLLTDFPEALHLAPDAEGVTPKDIVGHRAHWIALTLGWFRDGAQGKAPDLPAPGYKWSDLKRYNADLRAAQSDLGWTEVCEMLAENHAILRATIEGLDQATLYGGPMPGGRNAWTTGRWFEAAGPSHYRSAAKYLRARLRAAN